jgi:hypothetical protein
LKTADLINHWADELALGEKYKKQVSTMAQWKLYRDWYRGDFGDDYDVTMNATFAYIRSAIPRTYFRTPAITVVATQREYVHHARVVESIDNWLIKTTGLKKQLKSAILDTYLCGIGPIKLGYDSEYIYSPRHAADVNASTVTQVNVKDGSRIEYNANIHPGMPWGLRARPDEIITPYGYDSPESLPWIAHYILRPLEDCMNDAKYSSERKKLVGGFSASNIETFKQFNREGAPGRFVLLKEVRDRSTGKVYVFAEDKLLLEEEDSLQIDGLPWEFIIFNEDPEHFWPLPDVKMFAPQQKELNNIRTHSHKQRTLALLKFLFKKGSIGQDDLDRLLSGDWKDIGAGIPVDEDYLEGVVKEFTPNTNNEFLIREQERTESDMRSIMGFSQNQTGEFVPFHNKTAREASIVENASQIRTDERRDIVADVLSNIIRKQNQFIFKFWDRPQVAQIAGDDGFSYWVQYTGDQLKAEYSLNIFPETGMPVSREVRQQVAGELFDRLANDPFIDPIGLRRLLLQQTDIVDPSYSTLIRVPPEMLPPNPEMNISQQNPLNVQDLNNPEIGGKIFKPQQERR